MKDQHPSGQPADGSLDSGHAGASQAQAADGTDHAGAAAEDAAWFDALAGRDASGGTARQDGVAMDVHAHLAATLRQAYLAAQPESLTPDEAQRRRLHNLWEAKRQAAQARQAGGSPVPLSTPWWRRSWITGLAGTLSAAALLVVLRDSWQPDPVVPPEWTEAGQVPAPMPAPKPAASTAATSQAALPPDLRQVPPVRPGTAEAARDMATAPGTEPQIPRVSRKAAAADPVQVQAPQDRVPTADLAREQQLREQRDRALSQAKARPRPRPAPVEAQVSEAPPVVRATSLPPAAVVPAAPPVQDGDAVRTRGLPAEPQRHEADAMPQPVKPSPPSAPAAAPRLERVDITSASVRASEAGMRMTLPPFAWEDRAPAANRAGVPEWRIRTADPAAWVRHLLEAWRAQGVQVSGEVVDGGWRVEWRMEAQTPEIVRTTFEGLEGPSRLPDRGTIRVLPAGVAASAPGRP